MPIEFFCPNCLSKKGEKKKQKKNAHKRKAAAGKSDDIIKPVKSKKTDDKHFGYYPPSSGDNKKKRFTTPLDLLLSVAEECKRGGKKEENILCVNHQESSGMLYDDYIEDSNTPKQGIVKKAIQKDRFIYLTDKNNNEEVTEEMVRMTYKPRKLVAAIIEEGSLKNSRYYFLFLHAEKYYY